MPFDHVNKRYDAMASAGNYALIAYKKMSVFELVFYEHEEPVALRNWNLDELCADPYTAIRQLCLVQKWLDQGNLRILHVFRHIRALIGDHVANEVGLVCRVAALIDAMVMRCGRQIFATEIQGAQKTDAPLTCLGCLANEEG